MRIIVHGEVAKSCRSETESGRVDVELINLVGRVDDIFAAGKDVLADVQFEVTKRFAALLPVGQRVKVTIETVEGE